MKISQEGIELIKHYEGLRLKSYVCPAGVLTVGYGHTGKDVKRWMEITEERAEELLRNDLEKFEEGVLKSVKVELTQGQFDALVSFSFNLGLGNLKNSTLLRVLNEGSYEKASFEFNRWVFAGGKKLAGLVKRREAERELFNKA